MKKNEIPEKIYINPNLENRTWLIGKGDTSSIEYVRKDTFIKDTCEWIKKMWPETDDRFKEDYTRMLIEDFKNYIKG